MLTIHGVGSQQRESATSVSSAQMASRLISYFLGKRGDAYDSLPGRLAATDGPRSGLYNDCEACCGFGLGGSSGADTFCGHDASAFQHGIELVGGQIHEGVQFSRGPANFNVIDFGGSTQTEMPTKFVLRQVTAAAPDLDGLRHAAGDDFDSSAGREAIALRSCQGRSTTGPASGRSRSHRSLPIKSFGRFTRACESEIMIFYRKIMIFLLREAGRVGSPPPLETDAGDAVYPYKCRTMPGRRRNVAPAWCVEYSPDKAQVELESRLTGRRANLAGRIRTLGDGISHIPILEAA